MVTGAVAGATSVVVNTPIDVIKSKMQGLSAGRYANYWQCCKYVYGHE